MAASREYINWITDRELRNLYLTDYRKEGGHACIEYTTLKRKELVEEQERRKKQRKVAMDHMHRRRINRPSYYVNEIHSSYYVSERHASKGNKGTKIVVLAIVIIIIIIAAWVYTNNYDLFSWFGNLSTLNQYNNLQIGQGTTNNFTSTTSQQSSQTELINYALQLINKDREAYGLSPVSFSNISSGQQHANNMLQHYYMSHWDVYGLKPYMRYTLLNGTGAVSENIADTSGTSCINFVCSGNIDPKTAIQQMENNFVYNDSICCENGHRNNILDPNHNQVSIGIAYDNGRIYFVQDFIENYIDWNSNSPAFSNNEVYLNGTISKYDLNSITISYDPPTTNMTIQQLNSTFAYGYGNQIAGVVNNSNSYYTTMATIIPDKYYVYENNLDIIFSIKNIINQYGAGEYTIFIWFNNRNSTNSEFVGSTYTIFINSNGQQYLPNNI